jgi:hypothetical protein
MKKITGILVLLFSLFLFSCKPAPHKAQEYYEQLTNPLKQVVAKENNVIDVIRQLMVKDSAFILNDMSQKDSLDKKQLLAKLDSAYLLLSKQVKLANIEIEKMQGFDGKDELKKCASELLEEYLSVTENEYKKMMSICKIPLDKYTTEDDDMFFALSDSVDFKLQRKIETFSDLSKDFSKEYKFELPTDTTTVN